MCKLVVGSRAFSETSHLLERTAASPELMARLEELCSTGRLRLDLGIRVYYNRFNSPWASVPLAGPSFCDVTRRWHRPQVVTDDLLDSIETYPLSAPNREVLREVRALPSPQRPRFFCAFVFFTERHKEDLRRLDENEQLRRFREDLVSLGRLLRAISAWLEQGKLLGQLFLPPQLQFAQDHAQSLDQLA